MRRVSGFLVAAVLLLSLIVPSVVLAADNVPTEALRARKSVYRVLCDDGEYVYSGSSFVVGSNDRRTYLVTNYHVIEGSDRQSIVVLNRNGTEISAEVVGYDTEYDLCILQTGQPIKGAVTISLATQKASVGEAVYALGYPGAGDYLLDDYAYAVEDITVTDGIISAVKTVTTGLKRTTFLQMNAAINPGSSGGPLVNGAGQVVGINTLGIQEAQNVFAAVSSPHILEILKQYAIPFQSGGQTGEYNGTEQPGSAKTLVILIGLCAVLLLSGGVVLFVRARRLTLTVLLSRRLQGFSADEALQRLAPVFHALSQLHVRAEAHGNIHPANIYVDKFGTLHLGGRRRKCALNDKTKPYMPMEQYDGQIQAGTYSDIYALGAVVYAMIACTPPPDVMARLQNDTLEEQLNGIQELPYQMRQVILHAMSLKKEARLHDVDHFQRAVRAARHEACPQTQHPQQAVDPAFKQEFSYEQLSAAAISQSQLQPTAQFAHWYDLQGTPKRSISPAQSKKRRKILAFSCGTAVLLVMAGLLISNVSSYSRAVTCTESMDFVGASKAIRNTFLFYRDASTLSEYISAGRFLQAGRYQEAKDKFLALGDYRDAKNMMLECDYQKGLDLLQKDNYAQAKTLFTSISSYADSSTLLKEIDYQHATDIYNEFLSSSSDQRRNMRITQSLDLLKSLNGYKDSKAVLDRIIDDIYNEAITVFNNEVMPVYFEEYSSSLIETVVYVRSKVNVAKQYFQLVNGYKNSDQYIWLCESLDKTDRKQSCALLLKQWDFIPARRILLSDWYIELFLLGTWQGEGCFFTIKQDVDGAFSTSYDIPWVDGEYYKIENLIYFAGSDEDGWKEMYTIYAINENKIGIYAHSDGHTYTLYRQ